MFQNRMDLHTLYVYGNFHVPIILKDSLSTSSDPTFPDLTASSNSWFLFSLNAGLNFIFNKAITLPLL